MLFDLNWLFGSSRRIQRGKNKGRGMARTKPAIEALEGRTLLSLPTVNIIASDAVASKGEPDTGMFAVSRVTDQLALPLTVYYTFTGTAASGWDYKALSGKVVIPAGQKWTTIPIVPLAGLKIDGDTTVVTSLRTAPTYNLGLNTSATVNIIDHRRAAWPNAPFAAANTKATIYVNQYGDAWSNNLSLAAGSFNGFNTFFDDGGSIAFETTGSLKTRVAYYNREGQPVATDGGGGTGGVGKVVGAIPADKRALYLGVQAADGRSTGTYRIKLHGAPEGVYYPMDMDRATNSGTYDTHIAEINAPGDYDIITFITTRAGNWTVSLQPKENNFDVTMNVFDLAGNPIGGTFTQPINRGGGGVSETWTGLGLKANTKYFVRVDGKGNSEGTYNVRAQWSQPTVQVSATRPMASQGATGYGQFAIMRSAGEDRGLPLTVRYTLSGTAVNGTDYKRLSGTAVIPAGYSWTGIPIVPIVGRSAGGKSVVLKLVPSTMYGIGTKGSDTVYIADSVSGAWPLAPFSGSSLRSAIYVNQYGNATVTGRTVKSPADFDGYDLFFDDPGSMTLQVQGGARMQMGYYAEGTRPALVNSATARGGSATLSAAVTPDKGTLSLGIRPADSTGSGAYRLDIKGAPSNYIEPIAISSKNNAGSSGSDISGTNDFDFYTFTTPHAGNWLVSVIPDKPKNGAVALNATMNIYDKAGNPVGGTFTSAINAGGPGKTETWGGIGLSAKQQYFIRIDGLADSVGGYGVSVMEADTPTVNITASVPSASEVGPVKGWFTVTRTKDTISAAALPVSYTISGTARNGIDYLTLSGTVIIPAGKYSMGIAVSPKPDSVLDPTKSVVVTLVAGKNNAYVLGIGKNATVKIFDGVI